MEIIQGEGSLGKFLQGIENKQVTIVTAFASKTEDTIDTLLANGNQVTLLVGTINHFTDPVFFEHCRGLADPKNSRLKLWVDFRGQESVHWKLYLVEPDTVVIGSPNLTRTGLSMLRDTVVRLENEALCQEYQFLVAGLQRQADVLASTHRSFAGRLAEYQKMHRIQMPRPPANLPPGLGFLDWVSRDDVQGLPIFIWERGITREEYEEFDQEIKPALMDELQVPGSSRETRITVVGWCRAPKRGNPYQVPDVILTMKSNGDLARFVLVEHVRYAKGKWWLTRRKYARRPGPFTVTPELKAIIRDKAPTWYESGKTYLNSKDLRELEKRLERAHPVC
jgi:hypothetical protein